MVVITIKILIIMIMKTVTNMIILLKNNFYNVFFKIILKICLKMLGSNNFVNNRRCMMTIL